MFISNAMDGVTQTFLRSAAFRRRFRLNRLRLLLLCASAWVCCPAASAQTVETHPFAGINRPVPDGNAAGFSDRRVVVSSIAAISKVRVKLQVAGEFNGDLYGYLRCIQGGRTNFCVLLNRPGRAAGRLAGYGDAGFNVTFDDSASGEVHTYRTITNLPAGTALIGSWRPDGRLVDPSVVLDTTPRTAALSVFNGGSGNAEWTLFLADMESGGTNQLVSWELELSGAARPLVQWTPPASLTYGVALSAAQLNATSSVPGSFSYTPSQGTILNAGNGQLLSVTFTPSNLLSHTIVTTNVVINVLRAPLTIAAGNTNKVYGSPNPVLTANYSGFVNGDTTGRLTTLASVTTTATNGSPVGNYPITASGASASNYTIGYVSGTLTVTPAVLTVSAISTNKVYGSSNPVLTANYSGFVNGDTTARLTTLASVNTTSTTGSPVGTYPITASGASASNYTIGYVSGTLTVTKASTAGLVATSKNPTQPGEGVTFSFALSAVAPGAGVPSGVVQFKIDGVNSGVPVALVNGTAQRVISNLTAGSHTVVAEYAGDGNFFGVTNALSPVQSVNSIPVATLDSLERGLTNGTKVLVSALLANDSDADSDVVSFVSFTATSTNGASVTRDGDWIYYTPAARLALVDAFTYTISDSRGATAQGTVLVTVRNDELPSQNLILTDRGDGSYLIRFDGIPGLTYRIEWNSNVDDPQWQALGSATANSVGVFQFIDTPPVGSPQRYYRSVYP